MGSTAIPSLREKLAARGLAPSKARGQNFLRSEAVARRLVELSGLQPADAALEIGPGLGALTRPIAAVARRTLALEIDRGLVAWLREQSWPDSVEVRHVDALRADFAGLARELGPPVVLLGNLPYAIAGRLLGELLVPASPFRRMAFMLQLEVAERLLAAPGGAEWGPLGIWSRLWCPGRLLLELGPGEFEPRPRVRSAFVLLEPAATPSPLWEAAPLRRLVRTAFQHRRKTLRGALRGRVAGADAACEALGIDSRRRPETLSELEFAALARALERREQV